jgi:hypothetical protein
MLQLIEISLICTGIHVCFMEGMILSGIIKAIIDKILNILIMPTVIISFVLLSMFHSKCNIDEHRKNSFELIIKPLYDCLPCMASFWTCVILWKIDIKAMLIVCGMNAIIASVLQFFDSSKLPE